MLQNIESGKVLKKGKQSVVSAKTGKSVRSQKNTSKLPEISSNDGITILQSGDNLSAISVIIDRTNRAEWRMTPVEKMQLVKDGLNKIDLENLKSKTNLDYDKLSTLLATTRATLINKKGTAHFSAALSERMVSIADVYSYGFEVFEDQNKFNDWVFRPNPALGGKQPFELLDNQFGREEVKNLIGRIEYGVYS